jgi:hypothetical protein
MPEPETPEHAAAAKEAEAILREKAAALGHDLGPFSSEAGLFVYCASECRACGREASFFIPVPTNSLRGAAIRVACDRFAFHERAVR